MGTTSDPVALGRKFQALADAIDARAKKETEAVALAVKTTTLKRISDATGGDLALSGLGRGAPRRASAKKATTSTRKQFGVRYKLESGPGGPKAFVKATGPLPLIENDIPRHVVVSRYAHGHRETVLGKNGKERLARVTRASRIASVNNGLGAEGGGRRAVLHWGSVYSRTTTASSKGRKPWAKGVADTRPQIAQIHAETHRAAIRSVFR